MADYKIWYDLNNDQWTSRRVPADQTPAQAPERESLGDTPPQLTQQQAAEVRRILGDVQRELQEAPTAVSPL